jgi:tetratricopeptide (TPR) repeat protein
MPRKRSVTVVDNSHVARAVGDRIRRARLQAGLTQAQLSKGRYTAAYISALERGLAKPSMAALTFIAERLGVPARDLVGGDEIGSARLEADLLLASGRYQEALDRFTVILDGSVAERQRAEALRGTAEALCRLGRGADAVRPAAAAAEAFARIGQAADAAWARYWLASAHYLEDNTAEARGLLQEILAEHRAGLNVAPDFRFRLLTLLGQVEGWEGDPERALGYLEEARALTEGLDLRQRAAFLSSLALQYQESGDFERSVRAGMQSLALYQTAEAELEQAGLQNNLALAYLRMGSLERASEFADGARRVAHRLGDISLVADVAETEAEIAFAAGDEATALERINAALEAFEQGGTSVTGASAHVIRARIHRRQGEVSEATSSYEAAAELLRTRGPVGRLREVLAEWAELLEETGDLAAANRLYAEALGRRSSNRVGTGRERAVSGPLKKAEPVSSE